MSSDEDRGDSSQVDADGRKKRKVARACDGCRKMRMRCDAYSLDRAGQPCSRCVMSNIECTFVAPAAKRYPPKGYIEDLERRCEALERLIKRLNPRVDLNQEIGPKFNNENWATLKDMTMGHLVRTPSATPPSSAGPSTPPVGLPRSKRPDKSKPTASASGSDGDDGTFPHIEDLQVRLEKLSISQLGERFQRKAAELSLVNAALNLKTEAGAPRGSLPTIIPSLVNPPPPPPERSLLEKLRFPAEDLAECLIDMAFRRGMILCPIVHRPTFEAQRRAKLHLRNLEYAQVYLMICAVGAQSYTNEQPVTAENAEQVEWSSRGWPYFAQIMKIKRSPDSTPNLTVLQTRALMCLYLQGSSAPHAAWLLSSTTLHAAEDLYRAKMLEETDPFEEQMWKRVFWALVMIDRVTCSAGMNRPVVGYDEDVAEDLPLEVDDEYYDPIKREWRQPQGKPAYITGFIHHLKMCGILAHIYIVLSKLKLPARQSISEASLKTISDLDSILNSWFNTIPPHLDWSPDIEDDGYFDQAVHLRLGYHFTQITVHRTFIPALSGNNLQETDVAPSMVFCANSARSIIRVLAAYNARGFVGMPVIHVIGFVAATIILAKMWDMKKRNPKSDITGHLDDIARCLKYLQRAGRTCIIAARYCGVLTDVAITHRLPVEMFGVSLPDAPTRKRAREDESRDQPPLPSLQERVLRMTSLGTIPLNIQSDDPAAYQQLVQSTLGAPNWQPDNLPPSGQGYAFASSSSILPPQIPAQPSSQNEPSAASIPSQPFQPTAGPSQAMWNALDANALWGQQAAGVPDMTGILNSSNFASDWSWVNNVITSLPPLNEQDTPDFPPF